MQMDIQDCETPPEWAKNICTLITNMSSKINSLTENIESITIAQSTIKDNINTLEIKIDSFDTAFRHLDSKVSQIEENVYTAAQKLEETNSLVDSLESKTIRLNNNLTILKKKMRNSKTNSKYLMLAKLVFRDNLLINSPTFSSSIF